jgi:hypothetical protein
MEQHYIERRKYRRFEIPGGKVKYRKTGLLSFRKNFSEACPVLNASKGGLGFVCEGRFGWSKKVMVQLPVPEETPLNLYAGSF